MSFDSSIIQMLNNYPDDMPVINKLREILQQTALLGLARHNFFQHAVFYGGTSLRILYGLDRYSEDLDFALLKPDPNFNFTPFLHGMHQELKALGFELEINVSEKKSDAGILSAFLKGNTLLMMLSIQNGTKVKGVHPDEKIQIKLEIDIDPPLDHLPLESKLVINPVPFYVSTYAKSDLFAGKMHAALFRKWQNRIKGRDWYDLIWYIQNNVPVNLVHLRERMRQTKHLNAEEKFGKQEFLKKIHSKIDEIDWESAKKDIAPFISDKQRLALWSPSFFHDLLEHIRVLDNI